jgi:hypothetical protein
MFQKSSIKFVFGCWIILLGIQTGQSNAGEKKRLRVGEIWTEDEDISTGGWENTFIWPGNHWRRSDPSENILTNGTARSCGFSFGLKDWTDWKKNHYPVIVGGVHNTHLVHPVGGRFGVTPHEFKVILRRPPPTLIVDGELQPQRQDYDELDPNLISDAAMSIRWSQDVGLTCEQYYYAYASYPFDSYFFLDFLVKNTGNVNRNESTLELPDQVLHEVCFNFMVQPLVTFEGGRQSPHTGTENCCDDWVEYYGENYSEYLGAGTPVNPAGNPKADSLRIFFVWDGDNDKSPGRDDTGEPDFNEGFQEQTPGMGRLLSPQYLGFGILHADLAHDNEMNDLSQPLSTAWRPGDNRFSSCQEAYDYFFTDRHMKSPLEMGFTEPNDPVHVARPNPYVGIGPYEMPFGSDIHFTYLAAVNGLNHDLCNSLGLSWWTRWKGGTGLTDAEKNAWCATGKDSLFKYYGQATRRHFRNIENGRHPFDAPEAPPAPDLSVTAAEKSVILEWSDVSQTPDFDTGVADFAGYRIYRAMGRNDTTFQKIWECGGTSRVPVSTKFVDTSVRRGVAYYYYVTAYDDGSQNWEAPGRSLESGKYWNMMLRNKPVHPFLSREQVTTLEHVKVVPNPYNDKSTKFNWPGEESKLLFINIPTECTIRIFTVTGDLVKKIEHTAGTTEVSWNQVTDDNQLIYSGVYLYHVESAIGNAVGKFVVVRSSRIED